MPRAMTIRSIMIRTSPPRPVLGGRLPAGPAAQDSLFQLNPPVPGRDLISGANQIRAYRQTHPPDTDQPDPQHPDTTARSRGLQPAPPGTASAIPQRADMAQSVDVDAAAAVSLTSGWLSPPGR